MKAYLKEKVISSLDSLGLAGVATPTFEQPRSAEHGDLTTNIALVLSKQAKSNPRQLAQQIVNSLKLDTALVDRVDIAGPGFINFHFTEKFYQQQLGEILRLGKTFGRLDAGKRRKTQVEFVSANPTGPLTVGHGRGAVFGDTVARLLEWTNFDVTREYYFSLKLVRLPNRLRFRRTPLWSRPGVRELARLSKTRESWNCRSMDAT